MPLLLGPEPQARDAAHEAISALCSYNLEGKLALGEELLLALTQGRLEVGVAGWVAGWGVGWGWWRWYWRGAAGVDGAELSQPQRGGAL